MHKTFGTKEDVHYLDREGAYLIPCQNSRIAVVQTSKGYFVLGGGLEKGESHLDCLQRECLEEVGRLPLVQERLCSAEAYIKHPTFGYFHPIQTYYLGELLEKKSDAIETDHVLRWVEYEQLKGKMFVKMQNWALEQLTNLIK